MTQFLTAEQLAERWGVSTQQLANDRRQGRGVPWTHTGFKVLYSIGDVLGFEARGLRRPRKGRRP